MLGKAIGDKLRLLFVTVSHRIDVRSDAEDKYIPFGVLSREANILSDQAAKIIKILLIWNEKRFPLTIRG